MQKDIVTDSILSADQSALQQERREKRKELLEKKRQAEIRAAAAAERRSAVLKKGLIAAVILVAVMGLLFGRQWMQIRELTAEKARAQENLDALQGKITELESTLERVTSPEYIESEARSQLRMVYPNEVLYVVRESDGQ